MKGLISRIVEAILQNNFVHGLDGVAQSVERTSHRQVLLNDVFY